MKLGFDLDGCLAEFNTSFHELLIMRTGKDLFPPGYVPNDPPVWEWPRHFGYTFEEEQKVWEEVWAGRMFWMGLDVIEPRTLHQLNALNCQDGHEIHFITNRKGKAAQYQSGYWLADHGFRHPSVIIRKDKFPIIRDLELDAYIDDNIEMSNTLAKKHATGELETRIYLKSTRHNQVDRHPDLIVVESVWEMLEREGLV